MIIKAKFSSTCPTCGRRIKKGDSVEWSKGRKAVHADCSDVTPAYREGEPLGLTRSRHDRYGVYAADGHRMGSTCGCIDYPCCGH